MVLDGKAKVFRSVVVDNIVEANIKNIRGDTLWVRTRWDDDKTPTYVIGKNSDAIAYLTDEDLEAYASMIGEVRKATAEVLDGKG